MRSFYSGIANSVPNSPTDLLNYYMGLSQNFTPANQALGASMINDEHKKLLQDYFFNESSYSITTVAGQEAYPLPYNYSKLKTSTLTIGGLRWNPREILSRRDWDDLKTITNYQSSIPNNFFIYNGKLLLWPIQSDTSNTITFNYKIRVPDLSFTDYTAGTVSVSNPNGVLTTSQLFGGSTGYTNTTANATTGGSGSGCTVNTTCVNGVITSIVVNAAGTGYQIGDTLKISGGDGTATFYVANTTVSTGITGSSTAWSATLLNGNTGSVLNYNLWIRLTAPSNIGVSTNVGDGNWYQISSINTDTSITLLNNYQGVTCSGASYTIGQMPLLLEDFQDLLVYGPLVKYFSTINKDEAKLSEFKQLKKEGIEGLDKYCGTKSLNVNLATPPTGDNPNLYGQSFGGAPSN